MRAVEAAHARVQRPPPTSSRSSAVTSPSSSGRSPPGPFCATRTWIAAPIGKCVRDLAAVVGEVAARTASGRSTPSVTRPRTSRLEIVGGQLRAADVDDQQARVGVKCGTAPPRCARRRAPRTRRPARRPCGRIERASRPQPHRVVDAVHLGERPPERGVAVLAVGDDGEAVALADRVNTRRGWMPPEVGFCLPCSEGSSSSETVQTARSGRPSIRRACTSPRRTARSRGSR